jgi:nitrite reductase/ring-hydroxylating ferredoxin subunit
MRKVRYTVAREDEVEENVCTVVQVGDTGDRCTLVRHQGRVYAFGSLCPHQNAPFNGAPVDSGVVTCLRHFYRFDIKTGDCLTLAGYGIPVFPTATVDGMVCIDVWQDE